MKLEPDCAGSGVPGDYRNTYYSLNISMEHIKEAIENNDTELFDLVYPLIDRIREEGIEQYTDYAKRVNAPIKTPVTCTLDNLANEVTHYLKTTSNEKINPNTVVEYCTLAFDLINGNYLSQSK